MNKRTPDDIKMQVFGLLFENDRLRGALRQIALLDEADGHELRLRHAFEAVAIATRALGKHPSQIHTEQLTGGEQGTAA